MKKLSAIILTLAMIIAMCVPVMAENTDDNGNLTVTEDMIFDVCMHNTWADKSVECIYSSIETVGVTMTVSNYSGDPITTQLIVRESETWLHWQSEPVEITGDGTYTYYIDMNTKSAKDAETGEDVGGPFATENLLVLYVKDVDCCSEDETPLGQGKSESGVSCDVNVSVKFNSTDPAAAEVEDGADSNDSTDADKDSNSGDNAATEDATSAQDSGESVSNGLTTGAIIGIVAGAVVIAVVIIVVAVTRGKKNK